jgi:hypothetical protein
VPGVEEISNYKSQRRRHSAIRELARLEGRTIDQRVIRDIHRSLAGREITQDLVREELQKIDALRVESERSRQALTRFADVARGEYRMVDGIWQTKIHVDIAKTGIVFWIDIDEVRTADRRILSDPDAETPNLRAIAQRLRSATRLAAEPIRRRCSDLDIDAALAATDEDLVYVKAAMRQMALATTIPAAIIATIEATHARALSRSMALAKLAANPYEIRRIVTLEEEEHAPRRIIAIVGPTNSGKTHDAIAMLKAAPSGAYLAPLRLMAMENYDRLKQAGVAVDMHTGEESIETPGSTHVSATIEMADVDRPVSVAVIDEAQLLDDPQRGWAWTRAVFHMKAETLIVTGSPDCLPILRRIAHLTGETIELRTVERRAPLAAMDEPIDLSALRAGDAVIAFSRTNVLAMKAEISRMINPATSKPFKVATIYGTLGPEVRRSEAQRFSTGDAEILVATDAIGMGLNLPIDRVIFSTLVKYDGRIVRDLLANEIRQIGGRAGRHGQDGGGYVGMLSGAGRSTLPIRRALESASHRLDDPRPYIWPTMEQIERGMDALEVETLSKALPAVAAVLRNGPDYRCQIDPDTIDMLQTIEQFDIPLADKHSWIGCPLPLRDQENRRVLEEWATLQQRELAVRAPVLEYEAGLEIDDHRLKEIERTVVQAGAYLWLSRRWPGIFEDSEVAFSTRRDGNRMIEDALRQRHIHRNCRECGTPIGYRVRHETCRKCAYG